MTRRGTARLGSVLGALSLVGALAVLGCGGGDDSGGGAGSGSAPPSGGVRPTAPPPAQAGSFTPGPSGGGGGGGGGFVSGGGGGGFSGGGGGGGHHGPPRVGGMAAQLYKQAQARQARIERAHRGPQELTGLSDVEQRAADLAQAGRTAVVHYDVDADTCERAWAQGAATDTAYRAIRHDGMSPATGPEEERAFLTYCRRQTPEMQQCWDHDYRRTHVERCAELTQTRSAEGQAQMQRVQHAAAAHGG